MYYNQDDNPIRYLQDRWDIIRSEVSFEIKPIELTEMNIINSSSVEFIFSDKLNEEQFNAAVDKINRYDLTSDESVGSDGYYTYYNKYSLRGKKIILKFDIKTLLELDSLNEAKQIFVYNKKLGLPKEQIVQKIIMARNNYDYLRIRINDKRYLSIYFSKDNKWDIAYNFIDAKFTEQLNILRKYIKYPDKEILANFLIKWIPRINK